MHDGSSADVGHGQSLPQCSAPTTWASLASGLTECDPASVVHALHQAVPQALQDVPDAAFLSLVTPCNAPTNNTACLGPDDAARSAMEDTRGLVQDHVMHVLQQLGSDVLFVPDFGCAIMLDEPDDLAEYYFLRVFSVDGFACSNLPAAAAGRPLGVAQPCSKGTHVQMDIVRAWSRDSTLSAVPLGRFYAEHVQPALHSMDILLKQSKKKDDREQRQHTAGYFLAAVKLAVANMEQAQRGVQQPIERPSKLVAEELLGGFPDVAHRVGCKKPHLVIALVEGSFSCLLSQRIEQTGALAPTAPAQLGILFHVKVAQILASSAEPFETDLLTRNAAVAASTQATARLAAYLNCVTSCSPASPHPLFADYIATCLEAVEAVQRRACEAAVQQNLLAATYATPEENEAANFGPPSVSLPDASLPNAGACVLSLDATGGFQDTLPPLESLRAWPCEQVQRWLTSSARDASASYQNLETRAIAAQRWFHARALDGFACPRPSTAEDIDGLLEQYNTILDGLRAQHKALRVPPRLAVEVHSMGVLVTWIAVCICHRFACAEYAELREYALPVHERDLRHLVLSDGHEALSCVAAYVRRVREHAKYGAVFSPRCLDITWSMALRYARAPHASGQALRGILQRNARLAEQRIDAHWRIVQEKQAKVRQLEQALVAAQQKLSNAEAELRIEEARMPSRRTDVWGHVDLQWTLQEVRRDAAARRVAQCRGEVQRLQAAIALERRPPPAVVQALPEGEDDALVVLFFIFPQHAGSLPHLARHTFAAQHLLRGKTCSFNNAHFVWAAHFNRQHGSHYVPCANAQCPPAKEWDVILRAIHTLPPEEHLRPNDVMSHTSRKDGVFYPDGVVHVLGWQGGAAMPRGSIQPNSACIDPFPAQLENTVSRDSSLFFTEPCAKRDWLWRPSLPGVDVEISWEKQRGHDSRAGLQKIPDSFSAGASSSMEQWDAFTALRAYPYRQLSRLCAVLHDQKLPLDDTQSVWPCLRMLMHHIGPFELTPAAEHDASSLHRLWPESAVEALELERELFTLVEKLHDAPREAFQVPILCEIASVVNGHLKRGAGAVSVRLAEMSAHWANADLGQKLLSLIVSGATPNAISAARTACARAHSLAVIAFPPRLQPDYLSLYEAELLLYNAAKARQLYIRDAASKDHHFMAALQTQTLRTLAALAEVMDPDQHAGALTAAAAAVFSDAAAAHHWKACTQALGCYVSAPIGTGTRFSVSVRTGEVLRNGKPPARLSDAILKNSAYVRTFGDRSFDVDEGLWTTHAVLGRRYGFVETGSTSRPLVIKEAEPLPDGSELLLELLPADCSWCPQMPPRLRTAYSFWLSQDCGTVVLRGIPFDERTPHYIMLDDGDEKKLYRIPEHLQITHWRELRGKVDEMDEFRLAVRNRESAAIELLSRIERRDFIHVFRPASELSTQGVELLFELPRLHLKFQLTFKGTLESVEYSGYQVGESDTAGAPLTELDPILPPSFRSFIVLTSDDPLKPTRVLMPGGANDGSPCLSGAGTACLVVDPPAAPGLENLRSHVYDLAPRTQALHPQSLEGALLLAAVFAAARCSVRLPIVRCTPGEQAVALLRSSWRNEPLSACEAGKLSEVMSSALHTPALYLLCARLQNDSMNVAFLFTPGGTSAHGPAAGFDAQLRLSYAISACAAERTAYAGLPFHHPRRNLTASECRDVCVPGVRLDVHIAPLSIPRSERLDWDALSAAELKLHSDATTGSTLVSFSQADMSELLWYPQYLLRCFARDSKPSSGKMASLASVINTNNLERTVVGQHVLADTNDSLRAFASQPVQDSVDEGQLVALHTRLQEHRCRVREILVSLSRALIRALSLTPATVHGHVYRALRACNAVATPNEGDLVMFTIVEHHIQALNPFLTEHCRKEVRQRALWWQQLCVLDDKLTRCIYRCELLQSGGAAAFDGSTEALSLELANKRVWSVDDHPRWLAFEVLQGVEIREQQYLVARDLLDVKDEGRVLQLNMGEGKTRIILPMLVLELAGTGTIPRLNFLHELLTDAVHYLRACLTGSLLAAPLYLLPFNRDVDLSDVRIGGIVRLLRRCMHDGGFLCVSREHRLSLLLKIQERHERQGASHGLLQLEGALMGVSDFLDESDELLVHTFQLIYTYGAQMPLSAGDVRWDMVQALLFCIAWDPATRKYLAANEQIFQIQDHPQPGRMPEVRFVAGGALRDALLELYRLVLEALRTHEYVKWPSLTWLKHFDDGEALLDCCARGTPLLEAAKRLGVHSLEDCEQGLQLLMLRGLLYHGVLQHCLSNRLFVNFGFNDRSLQRTKLAVPFRHCDVPSERADFKHPDVALLYTHISYYHAGLTDAQIVEVYSHLLTLGPSQRADFWRRFLDLAKASAPPGRSFTRVDAIEKVDLRNIDQFSVLRDMWRHNMKTINFWLATCMLPQATAQFPENMRATAWHITAPSRQRAVCGFSGTNDNTLLLPLDVTFGHPEGGAMLATNGKMLNLLLQPDTCTFASLKDATAYQDHAVAQSGMSANRGNDAIDIEPWKRLLRLAADSGAAALIDAGALLAGVELENAARYLAGLLFDRQQRNDTENLSSNLPQALDVEFRGVVFFSGEWHVMDLRGVVRSKRVSPIQEADAIVIFDDARCRGADMKLRPDARALLTLGPGMLRSKLMQAAGRMRQLEKRQSLKLIGSDEVCTSIRGCCSLDAAASITPQHVIQWVLQHTAAFVKRGLLEFSRQGQRYAHFRDSGSVKETEKFELAVMYEAASIDTTVAQAFHRLVNNDATELGAAGGRIVKQLLAHVDKFGSRVHLLLGSAEEECEREVEEQEEEQIEAEVEKEPLRVQARPERDWLPDWEAGLRCESMAAFMSARITPVRPLQATVALMKSAAHLERLSWPQDVYASENFTFVAQGHDTELASIMPYPTALLCFPDGSLLVVSEREADACDRILRHCHATQGSTASLSTAFRPWLLTLPYARATLAASRTHADGACLHDIDGVSLVKGPTSDGLSQSTLHTIAQGVAAVQLFAGETMFGDEDILRGLVLPREQAAAGAERQEAVQRCMRICQELMALRARSQHWDGSTLAKVFQDERDKAVAAGASLAE